MGSTEAARRAGTKQARAAAAMRMRVTPARIRGLRELSMTQRVESLSKTMLRIMPATRPVPTLIAVEASTIWKTSDPLAPRAMRMPNSFLKSGRALCDTFEPLLERATRLRACLKLSESKTA
jgi:hypothetical protein